MYAQPYVRELNSIPFRDKSGLLPNIFSGGTNNIEHQFIDINGDGLQDIMFLNSDGTYGWYKNTGSSTIPLYNYMLDTIPGFYVSNWFYFCDIDKDGDFDLLTSNNNYIQFRRNTGNATTPFFTIEIDTLKDNNGTPIHSDFISNPVFCDIDGDNDIDFFSGNSIGTLNYYENIGTPFSFNFKFITDQWQGLYIISGGGKSIENKHGASSIDFIDIDHDGDHDLFWGDFFSKSLYFIKNTGTAQVPHMEVTRTSYPANADSIYTSGYNMPRFTDIDHDGDYDLFVSVLYDPTVPQSLMYYKNNGTNTNPNYAKVTSDFLKTLDGGIQSVPVLTDIDSDGDLDLFIGTGKNPNGSIMYFKNTGSAANPSYELMDSIYAGISGELSLAPSFSDLDNDGDKDLIVGNFNGTFSFYRNTGTASAPSFQYIDLIKDESNNVIDIGLYARPFLIDIDNDNDPDLVTGGFNGKITLYRNTGTTSLYRFTAEPVYFGNIDAGDNSTPFMIDYDGNGSLDLFCGSREGNVIFYKNTGSNSSPQWQLITSKFLDRNFGGDTVPFFADIDNDGDKDFILGNVKGGLYFYRNSLITGINEPSIKMEPDYFIARAYPNPFNPEVTISLQNSLNSYYTVKIFNSLGEEVNTLFTGYLLTGSHSFRWYGRNKYNSPCSSGTYIVLIQTPESIKSLNIILLK